MSRTRAADRYNTANLFVLRDRITDNLKDRRGIAGCEVSHEFTETNDQLNYGDTGYNKYGYITGWTYLQSKDTETVRGQWFTVPMVQSDGSDLIEPFDGLRVAIKEDYELYARGKKWDSVKKRFTMPLLPDAPISKVQPNIIIDDKYVCQVGPSVLAEDKASSWVCTNGIGGWGYMRNLMAVVRNPSRKAQKDPISGRTDYDKEKYKKFLDEQQKETANSKYSPGTAAAIKLAAKQQQERVDWMKDNSKIVYDIPECVALELGKAPDGDWGYGMVSWGDDYTSSLAAGAPSNGFVTGKSCVKHRGTSSKHSPAHIHTDGFFFMDTTKDGALKFEKNPPPDAGDALVKRKVHLQFSSAEDKWIWWSSETLESSQPSTPSTPGTPENPPLLPPTTDNPSKPAVGNPPEAPPHNGPNDNPGRDGRKPGDAPKNPPGVTVDDPGRYRPSPPPEISGPTSGLPRSPWVDGKPGGTSPDSEKPAGESIDGPGRTIEKNPKPGGGFTLPGLPGLDEPLPDGSVPLPGQGGSQPGGYAPGGSKTQQSFPSMEGAVSHSIIGDPAKLNSNSEYRAQRYSKRLFDAGAYEGDPVPYRFSAQDWINEELSQETEKRGKVLTYTLAAYAEEDTNNRVETTQNSKLKFRVPASKGGVFFAPADCNNQNTVGQQLANKAQFLLHPTRSELAFGYPRQTEKAIIKYDSANDVLQIDMSGCSGLQLSGLPAIDPGGTDLVWKDGINLAIT